MKGPADAMGPPRAPVRLSPGPDASRRAWLGAGGALGLAALAGCACPLPSLPLDDGPLLAPGALAPPEPASGSLELPVVIDAHCHIFNVEDVPAAPMLKGPIAHTLEKFPEELMVAFADLIAAIAYLITPGARTELAMLEELVAKHRAVMRANPNAARTVADDALRIQQEKFARAFAREAQNPRFLKPFLRQRQAYQLAHGQAVDGFVISEDNVRAMLRGGVVPPRAAPGASGHPDSLVPFACTLTSPRHCNLVAMQKMYAGGPGVPAVDVFCPSMLDLDHWLGCPFTAASQHDQMLLMEQVAAVSGGAILPFIGYNPRTDVLQQGASFARVIDAVGNRGFIGVKVYPPMGYRGYGNAPAAVVDACPAIEDGGTIDAALGRLYAWCVDHNVPVMAHTSHSFGRSNALEDCASPLGWRKALENFDGLRIQAGHFGGTSDHAIDDGWAKAYVTMAGTPQGRNLHVDLSNLDDLFVSGSPIGKVMEPLIASTPRRMVYGSDWYMIEVQGAAATYASAMSTYIGRIEDSGIADLRKRVFGLNAATLYGLVPRRVGGRQTNWDRLVAYYEKHRIPRPRWMRKLAAA